MSQSSLIGTTAPLIVLPVAVTILLNIVGAHGIGPLSAEEAEASVLLSAFVVIVYLQLRRSANKTRTGLIHAGAVAAYAIMVFFGDHHESSSAYSMFSLSPVEGFVILMIVHTGISYIVLATTSLAGLHKQKSHVVSVPRPVAESITKRSNPNAANNGFRLNVWMLVALGLLELFLLPAVTMSASSETGGPLVGAVFLLIVTAFHVYLQGDHSKNWKQTRRIHGIIGGIAVVTLLILASDGGFERGNWPERIEEMLMFVSILYWVVSFTVLCIVVYLNKNVKVDAKAR